LTTNGYASTLLLLSAVTRSDRPKDQIDLGPRNTWLAHPGHFVNQLDLG